MFFSLSKGRAGLGLFLRSLSWQVWPGVGSHFPEMLRPQHYPDTIHGFFRWPCHFCQICHLWHHSSSSGFKFMFTPGGKDYRSWVQLYFYSVQYSSPHPELWIFLLLFSTTRCGVASPSYSRETLHMLTAVHFSGLKLELKIAKKSLECG